MRRQHARRCCSDTAEFGREESAVPDNSRLGGRRKTPSCRGGRVFVRGEKCRLRAGVPHGRDRHWSNRRNCARRLRGARCSPALPDSGRGSIELGQFQLMSQQ